MLVLILVVILVVMLDLMLDLVLDLYCIKYNKTPLFHDKSPLINKITPANHSHKCINGKCDDYTTIIPNNVTPNASVSGKRIVRHTNNVNQPPKITKNIIDDPNCNCHNNNATCHCANIREIVIDSCEVCGYVNDICVCADDAVIFNNNSHCISTPDASHVTITNNLRVTIANDVADRSVTVAATDHGSFTTVAAADHE